MPLPDRHWTVEDLATLPDDGNRYEILDGELLVTPAPSWRHQWIVLALARRIADYVERHPIGAVLIAPADVEFAPDTMLEPDLFVVPLVDGRRPMSFSDVRRLLLAVETLSASTMRHDRYRKRPRYQEEGVPETWIVDGDARAVEVWRPRDELPDVVRETLSWQPDPAYEPLVIDLVAVFREADAG